MTIAPNLADLPRAFVDSSPDSEEFTLGDSAAHHLAHVLRLNIGDSCLIIEKDSGTYFSAQVINKGKKLVLKRTGPKESSTQKHESELSILIALCKGEKNERIIDWATELGVSKIIFFEAERSVVRIKDESERIKKEARFNTIAESATLQSGRTICSRVSVHLSLKSALNSITSEVKFLCSLRPDAKKLYAILDPLSSICVAIGPEGDFTDEEEEELRTLNFKPISLGTQVLRSELAVVTALSSLVILHQSKQSNQV